MDGWKITYLLGRPSFRGYVSFREGRTPPNLLGWFSPIFLHMQPECHRRIRHGSFLVKQTVRTLDILSTYLKKTFFACYIIHVWFIYPQWMVYFNGKCRKIYQSHGLLGSLIFIQSLLASNFCNDSQWRIVLSYQDWFIPTINMAYPWPTWNLEIHLQRHNWYPPWN